MAGVKSPALSIVHLFDYAEDNKINSSVFGIEAKNIVRKVSIADDK